MSRTRSQSPQNGLVTVGMMPIMLPGAAVSVESTVEETEPIGRSGAAGGHHFDRIDRVDRLDDLVLTDDLVVHPVTLGVERHELDEAHLDVLLASECGEVDDLVVVDAPLDDRVDLDRGEARLPARR